MSVREGVRRLAMFLGVLGAIFGVFLSCVLIHNVLVSPAPNKWNYLLAVVLPFAAFAIPWALVRGIGWVGAGFFSNSK